MGWGDVFLGDRDGVGDGNCGRGLFVDLELDLRFEIPFVDVDVDVYSLGKR